MEEEPDDNVNEPRSFLDTSQCLLRRRQPWGFSDCLTFHFRERVGVKPPSKVIGFHVSLSAAHILLTAHSNNSRTVTWGNLPNLLVN